MKRIVLFVLTNVAVLAVLTIVLKVLGLDRVVAQEGFAVGPLLAFSAVVGFTGAIISLLMSKPMAKWSTGAQVIDGREARTTRGSFKPSGARAEGRHRHARSGGLRGPSRTPSRPAQSGTTLSWRCSTGLLQSMNMRPTRCGAVLGHEIAHVANGDMVTLTLIQGVVNTFVDLPGAHHRNDRRPAVFRSRTGHRFGLLHHRNHDRQIVLGLLASA